MWRRIVLGYFNGDVIYLLFQKKSFQTGYVPGKEPYYWGMASASWLSWQVSSIIGILLASLIPDNWGLALAGTLALIPVMVSAINSRATLVAVSVAGIVALLGFDLPYRLALPLAVIAAIVAGSAADLMVERAAGKRVFIRADLNVPQDDAGNITEDTRVRASVPCIRMALDAGAAVMVTSHLGRPTEGEFKPEDSLAPVAKRLSELLGRDVPLVANWVDGVDVKPGSVVLLENVRVNKGEKKNNPELAKKMAALCDIFVNDAFGTAHRAEASTYGIAEYAPVACAGPLLAAEIDAITQALAARSARWWRSSPAARSRPS
jgi:hypothetical protein